VKRRLFLKLAGLLSMIPFLPAIPSPEPKCVDKILHIEGTEHYDGMFIHGIELFGEFYSGLPGGGYIYFNRHLTPDEQRSVESYLRHKYEV